MFVEPDVKPLLTENVNIENRTTIVNPDGTLTINNKNKQPQKIRFSVDGPLYKGEVNIKKILFNNGVYCIITKKDVTECFEKNDINNILSFVDTGNPNFIDFGMFKGKLMMTKVK